MATAVATTSRNKIEEASCTPSVPATRANEQQDAHASTHASCEPTTSIAASTREHGILQALKDQDWTRLRQYSHERRGFESDKVRRRVWPFLLGCNNTAKGKQKADDLSITTLEPHPDERQVHLDVIRSFVSYPEGISDRDKDQLRDKLERVIVATLRRYPALQYFQGFHDIATVLLLVLEDQDVALRATARMCLHRIRDNMGTGLEPVMGYLRLVRRILRKVDSQLADLVDAAAELPYFSLSWVLTLMSHDLTSLGVIARLFDFLLSHNPAMISYVGAAIILMKKQALLELDSSAADDPAILHHTLSQLPNFVETPSEPGTPQLNPLVKPPSPRPAATHTPVKPTTEDLSSSLIDVDEDLMSSRSRSDSRTTLTMTSEDEDNDEEGHERDMDMSVLSYSTVSNDSVLSIDNDKATHGFKHRRGDDNDDDNDTEVFEEMMLSDPDVVNLALAKDDSRRRKHSSSSRSISSSNDHAPRSRTWSDASSQRDQKLPVMSIDELIERALELYERFPLLGQSSVDDSAQSSNAVKRRVVDSIDADQVMGPNSCIFTWPLSVEGRLTNDGAHQLAKSGKDVVLPVKPGQDELSRVLSKNELDDGESAGLTDEQSTGASDLGRTNKRRNQRQRTTRQIGLGTSLIVLGLTGVFLAFYGNEVKEFVTRSVPGAATNLDDKRDWSSVASYLFKYRS
ncbi:hypothetical protein ACM66B_003623 [Microbotryomycetes sp. NB124-2]